MRIRIHHVLFAGFLGIIMLLVGLTLPLLNARLSESLRETFRAELQRQLALGAALMEAAPASATADSLARVVTERIRYRVTVIDTSGAVLGESYVAPGRLPVIESHASRPEVREALESTSATGFAERSSETVGEPLLYAARLTAIGGQPVVLRVAAPRTEIQAAVGRAQRAVAVAGVLATMVALVAAYLLSRLFARPLVELSERTRRLARGDFSAPVASGRVAELRDAAVAFNRLSDELRERLSQLGTERDDMRTLIDTMAEGVLALDDAGRLTRANRTARHMLRLPAVGAGSPVGALVRAPALREALEASLGVDAASSEVRFGERHLLLSSRRLEGGGAVTTLLDISELRRLEAVRRDFIANASHELKTPLTAIRGFAETLVDDDPPAAVRRQFLEAIRNNTLRLQHVVDDLLDLSRLESGGWTAITEPVTVAEVAQEAWDMMTNGSGTRRLGIRIEGEGIARADRHGLVQIFRNLMENAVRHTGEDGRVEVYVRSAPEERPRTGGIGAENLVIVEVSDDGEGISGRALPRIFERFYRADSSRARDVGGTGLGLAIVKHLVGAMGGSIEADSELGRGTTIRFTLPAVGRMSAGPGSAVPTDAGSTSAESPDAKSPDAGSEGAGTTDTPD